MRKPPLSYLGEGAEAHQPFARLRLSTCLSIPQLFRCLLKLRGADEVCKVTPLSFFFYSGNNFKDKILNRNETAKSPLVNPYTESDVQNNILEEY